MSYTNAHVSWQGCIRENGTPKQDAYGDMQYLEAETIRARKQPMQELVRTADGREYLSRSIYYIDPRVSPQATQVQAQDKLDGELVIDTYVMCDLRNRPRMVRARTI